eukprot:gnl/TRDRNA2_/TRDRNA2_176797_c0_seq1.p1 gnl/TRDRNA2_/TRDRNA2_176797_c0~~gnl/TRDRNA2_/TRDRNA2_176797_c0_seq1.p1  ORF type:complete len:386 (-),score=22.61 gnl/TRDRNA2_/TRDRNA2_176797_c0_seq1:359-1516(-)
MNGMVYGVTSTARAYALSMSSGKEIWSTKFSWGSSGNYGSVAAHEGVVILAADAYPRIRNGPGCCGPSDHTVFGINATSGCVLWKYFPDVPVWNYHFTMAGNGTFVFQDLEGRVYRNKIADGTNLWKSGGFVHSWTDGGAIVGPNGIAYAVNNGEGAFNILGTKGPCFWGAQPYCGSLTAYRLTDGKRLWSRNVPAPPNNIPAVGKLHGLSGLSVVQPIGQQCTLGQKHGIYAFNAESGELQWTYELPWVVTRPIINNSGTFGKLATMFLNMAVSNLTGLGGFCAGDFEGIEERKITGIQTLTMPNPWGPPSIDGQGTVYVGSETGHFVALRDTNGDGQIKGDDEVSVFETGAAFVGSSGPAFAPGLMAVASISSMHVWTTDKTA